LKEKVVKLLVVDATHSLVIYLIKKLAHHVNKVVVDQFGRKHFLQELLDLAFGCKEGSFAIDLLECVVNLITRQDYPALNRLKHLKF